MSDDRPGFDEAVEVMAKLYVKGLPSGGDELRNGPKVGRRTKARMRGLLDAAYPIIQKALCPPLEKVELTFNTMDEAVIAVRKDERRRIAEALRTSLPPVAGGLAADFVEELS